MTALEWVALALMVVESLFTLLAAVGVVRMPDILSRLSATSKAAPFGVALVLAGTVLVVGQVSFALQAAAVAAFVAITSPVAAHALARAAYRTGEARGGEATHAPEDRTRPHGSAEG